MMQKKELGQFLSGNRLILIVAFFTLLARIVFLNKYPIGITHDELNYIIAAKSLNLVGGFAPGTAPAILPTTMKVYDIVIAEIPALVLSLTVGFLKTTLFNSRILGALFSCGSVILLYLFVKRITKNQTLALLASVVMAINPWSFLMGRTIFEVNFYIFFFLIFLNVLFKYEGKKIYYSLLFFLLGFFSYTGGQISFLLFFIASLIFKYKEFDKPVNKRIYLRMGTVAGLAFLFYVLVVVFNQSTLSRSGELFLPTSDEVAHIVNTERIISVQNSLRDIFINKLTIYTKLATEKYLNAFSVNRLFLNGEFRAAFSLIKHGNFYVVDFLMIFIGIIFMVKMYPAFFAYIISVILIAPVTSVFSTIELSYSQRSGLMYPFLIILVAAGILYLFKISERVAYSKYLKVLFIGIYLLLFINMLYLYFNRFPIYASEGWFFQDRQLSSFIQRQSLKDSKDIIIYSPEPKIVFEEYLFYTNNYNNREKVSEINTRLNEGRYGYNTVQFILGCPDKIEGNDVVIVDSRLGCVLNDNNIIRITRFMDVAEEYLIVNSDICNNYQLNLFVDPRVYGDFYVERMDTKQFCESWITKI